MPFGMISTISNFIPTKKAGGGIGQGLWVAVGDGANLANTIATSTDGTAWTGLGKTIFSNYGSGVAYGNGRLVAVGWGGNSIATSRDGNVWTGLGKAMLSSGGASIASKPI